MRRLGTTRIVLADIARKGFFHLLSANFLVNLLAFGSQIVVVRFLTAVELGQVKTLQSFVSVAVILAGFGFNAAVLKLCSEKRPPEEREEIYLRNLRYIAVPIGVVLAGLLAASRLGLLSPDPAVNRWMPVYMWTVPALTYIALTLAFLQALKKIRTLARMQLYIGGLGFAALVGATALYGIDGYIIAKVAAGYVLLASLFLLVKPGGGRAAAAGKDIFNQSLFYAKWSVAGNAVAAIGLYVDIFLLNYLIADRVQFGYYSLAVIFINGLFQLTHTIQTIATPYFSEKSGDRGEFIRVLKKYQGLMVRLALAVSLVLFFAVPAFIRLIYGGEYGPAGFYFRILLLKFIFRSCAALPGVAILGLGKMRYNFAVVSISVPLSILFSYILIINYGLIGAAWAQGISYLVALLIVAAITRHVVRIHFPGA